MDHAGIDISGISERLMGRRWSGSPPPAPGSTRRPRRMFSETRMSSRHCSPERTLSGADPVTPEGHPDPSLWSHAGPVSALSEFASADLRQVQNVRALYNPRAFALASP